MHFYILLVRWIIRLAEGGLIIISFLRGDPLGGGLLGYRLFGLFPLWFLLWAAVLLEMLVRLVPALNVHPTYGKMYARSFFPTGRALSDEAKRNNRRAGLIMLGWLAVNLVFGLLRIAGVFTDWTMLLIATFYYLSDLICILFWCPFQLMMNSRCCVTCRLYSWGYFFFCTPLLFIPGFFPLSLFVMGLVLLLCWEYAYFRFPERFFETTNQSLSCQNCKTHLCKVKGPYLARFKKTVRHLAGKR